MQDNSNEGDISDRLSPIERKIVPFLSLSFDEILSKSGLDEVSIIRGLRLLENKGVLELVINKREAVELGTNGIYYKKNHLPERQLLSFLEKNGHCTLEEAQKSSKLSENEFKVSLGILKGKAFITLSNGKISLNATKEEIIKKSLEEQFIDSLPLYIDSLSPEQKFAFDNLKKRKDIIIVQTKSSIKINLTESGKNISGKVFKSDLIEELTPDMIKNWSKQKKFRKYDMSAQVPRLIGGRRHFMNEAIERGKKIWLEMGFKEMSGNKAVTSFWNFDALFTAQDHPVREMQDTFFIKGVNGKLPDDKELVSSVKSSHETGVHGSKGWQYEWKKSEAERVVLRTHTTCLSAQTLASLRKMKDKRGKFFAIGKCFRNETVDWSHGFEFNQAEGIVIDPKANFRNLLGYLREFFKKMGFSDVKFVPSFFPYTEPSVEVYGYNNIKKKWMEIGGAGILRPEVTVPLLGEYIPVLAWGPGFDRTVLEQYKIADLREMYENDLKDIREKKIIL